MMPRHANPKELSINLKTDQVPSKTSTRPTSSPIDIHGIDLSSFDGGVGLTSLPALPASPPTSPRSNNRDPAKNILSTLRGNKPRDRSPQAKRDRQGQGRTMKDEEETYPPDSSSMSKIYHLKKAPGSTPELSLVGGDDSTPKHSEVNNTPQFEQRPQPSPQPSEDSIMTKRREKAFRNPLNRTKSVRRDSASKASRPNGNPTFETPPNTAPLNSEWANASEMGLSAGRKGKDKERRNKSAERAGYASRENLNEPHHHPAPAKENKNMFVSGGKTALSKAKTGGGAFFTRLGKIGRSGSNSGDREVPDSEYVLKLVSLPLVEQTRKTRISKKLEACKDKTEYWMPSLPWRCIDYLNLNCESEGLYRVPGSGPQIKHWQRRFDSELDVDLLDEHELYDPNTIASMLKQWLREMPTEIFPAQLQHDLGIELERENPDYNKVGQPAPQRLRDALSELSPFNYYLLFAVTCHLSLLLSHQDKNRMDLNNLSICIGPCLKMERWLFNYLVGDWRHCWQGCWTEKEYLEVEKRLEDPNYIPTSSPGHNDSLGHRSHMQGRRAMSSADADERVISSGNTSSASTTMQDYFDDARSNPEERPVVLRPFTSSTSSRTQANLESASARLQQQQQQQQQQQRPPVSLRENSKPSTYIPAGNNASQYGSIEPTRPAKSLDVRRPSTAEDKSLKRRSGEQQTPRLQASTPASLTPRPSGHSRSHSDLPTTPVRSTMPDPFR